MSCGRSPKEIINDTFFQTNTLIKQCSNKSAIFKIVVPLSEVLSIGIIVELNRCRYHISLFSPDVEYDDCLGYFIESIINSHEFAKSSVNFLHRLFIS